MGTASARTTRQAIKRFFIGSTPIAQDDVKGSNWKQNLEKQRQFALILLDINISSCITQNLQGSIGTFRGEGKGSGEFLIWIHLFILRPVLAGLVFAAADGKMVVQTWRWGEWVMSLESGELDLFKAAVMDVMQPFFMSLAEELRKHGRRLDEIAVKLEERDKRFDRLEERMDRMIKPRIG
ncbi:MAG: hypothetical protein M1379_15945 [Firmicutes bacterium]|nr:hypothetical protein [Bacillota bacterium]